MLLRWLLAAVLSTGSAYAQEPPARALPNESTLFSSPGAHFNVLFEGPADEILARRAVDLLDEAYYNIGTALYTFPDRVITVILYTQEQFRDVTRSPDWAAAAYDGTIRVSMRGALEKPQELKRVLTHELTHAMVQNIAPRGVPTWLHEGLAVYFEGNSGAWADQQLAASPARLSLQQLSGSFAGLSTAEGRMAYAQSAVTVRRLIDTAGPDAVTAILHDLARGERLETAFEQRTLMPYMTLADLAR
jgi:hypothetical protein